MTLGSTQPLTEMSTSIVSWGKGDRCVRLTTLPPSCAVVTKSGKLNFLKPSGPVQVSNGTALPLHFPFTFTCDLLWFPRNGRQVCIFTQVTGVFYSIPPSFLLLLVSPPHPTPHPYIMKKGFNLC